MSNESERLTCLFFVVLLKQLERNILGIMELEFLRGDITKQPDIDAIVNAANAELKIGGGVAGAIHRAAGEQLYEECRPMAPIKPGEAVITKAYNLPNKHVIHCLGPVYGVDQPSDLLLKNCYSNALDLAEKHQISSIAFPAISTGVFGYPLQEAAEIAIKAIQDYTRKAKSIELVRMVLFSKNDLDVFQKSYKVLSNS